MVNKRIISTISIMLLSLVVILTVRSSADASGASQELTLASTCEQILARAH